MLGAFDATVGCAWPRRPIHFLGQAFLREQGFNLALAFALREDARIWRQFWVLELQSWWERMADFQARFEEALRRRLYPNAPLHLKEIAGAIGRSENSVTRWWRGETHIRGGDLYRIARFFFRRGDAGFLREVFSDFIATGASSEAVEARVVALIRDALSHGAFAAHHGKELANDEHIWFTADGQV